MRNLLRFTGCSILALTAAITAAVPAGAAPARKQAAATRTARAQSQAVAASQARAAQYLVTVDSYREMSGAPLHRRGAGVLVNADGFILTPSFVVDEAETVFVSFANGERSPAYILGTDGASSLAVLKINFLSPGRICPKLCESSREADGAAVRLLTPGPVGRALRGKVIGSARTVGPLNEVTEVDIQGSLSDWMGGIVVSDSGELVGLALATRKTVGTGGVRIRVYITPASRMVDAIGRVASAMDEPVRRPAADKEAPFTLDRTLI